MALGNSKPIQSSKQKKIRKRSKISENAKAEPAFSQPRPTPKALKRAQKRPSKKEKRRELRDAQEFPGIKDKVNGEARSLVPGEGILQFRLPNAISDTHTNGMTTEETGGTEEVVEDTGFISLDLDDESTEIGQKFVEYEEEYASTFKNAFPCPWVDQESMNESKETVGDQITSEVLDFLRYMSPTKAEIKRRDDCVTRLRRVVKQLWPNATISVFGSYATGMYLPDADIDVVILGDEVRPKIRGEMFRLSARLKSNQIAENVSVISHARVPIIKYVEKGSGYNVDIAFSQGGGIDTVYRVNSWLEENKALKPLAMVVRQFLKRRNLSDVATGGLGGYATLCMVYSRMQQRLKDMQGAALENVGLLLLDFFEYYGHQFDNVGQYIRPRAAPYCQPCSKRLNGSMATPQPVGLAIEDPNDTNNNISKASYNYPTVKRSFANAADYLKGLCLEWQKLAKPSRPQLSFLGPLLKFSGKEPRRSKVTLDRALSVVSLQPQPQPQSQSTRLAQQHAMAQTRRPEPRKTEPRRSDDRIQTKPTPKTSPKPQTAVEAMSIKREKGHGVDSYDPWVGDKGKPDSEEVADQTLINATNTTQTEKRKSGFIEIDTAIKRRTSDLIEAESSSDDDESDSRTKLTTAQRRQFWSRKAGNPEITEPQPSS